MTVETILEVKISPDKKCSSSPSTMKNTYPIQSKRDFEQGARRHEWAHRTDLSPLAHDHSAQSNTLVDCFELGPFSIWRNP